MNIFENDIQYVKGIGPKMRPFFMKLNILTVKDLLYYPPRKYINRKITQKTMFNDGEYVTLICDVVDSGTTFTRNRKTIFNALLKTENEYLYAKWFNNRYIMNVIKPGIMIIVSGNIKHFKGMLELIHPEYEIVDSNDMKLIHTGRIIPLYSLTKGLHQKYFRRVVHNAIFNYSPNMHETLPDEIICENKLMGIREALVNIHYPADEDILEKAIFRMKYEELFNAGKIVYLRKKKNTVFKDFIYQNHSTLVEKFIQGLSFDLTDDQKKAIEIIINDMQGKESMNRILMGDVGVGKTVVAVCSLLFAVDSGYQCAFMAPTEILARQHYSKISKILEDLNVNTTLITSSVKKTKRKLKEIEKGDIDIIIGTHALIEDNIIFDNLRFIVIDEQHRFGVMQRNKLREKGKNADYLIMTATPIPRSMSMILYGDLDSTLIKQRPSMQKPVKTKWVSDKGIEKMYDFVKKILDKNQKCFVVCPVIDENNMLEIKSVEETYKKLKIPFKDYKIGRIHSRLPQEEKEKIMEELKNGDIQILIGTTVIEVGIDIPDATVMIIVNSERFGLSQLHQLRGRVGRSILQSYCFLCSGGKIGEEGINRLKIIANSNDGFYISEMDLKLRGPGELWGTKQSGIPEFKYADFIDDFKLMKKAFDDASVFIERENP